MFVTGVQLVFLELTCKQFCADPVMINVADCAKYGQISYCYETKLSP